MYRVGGCLIQCFKVFYLVIYAHGTKFLKRVHCGNVLSPSQFSSSEVATFASFLCSFQGVISE